MIGPTRASLLSWRRAIAMAIAELLEEKTLLAWHHLDAWTSLERAGVPGKDIRHALDRKPVPTQAGDEVAKWQKYDGRGALVLCDAKDSGKTFAAVHWALARHREGKATMWLSGGKLTALDLDARALVLRRAHDADALVFDDLGAGTTTHEGVKSAQGGYFRKQLEGLLHDRAQRPTLVTSNMNKAETEKYLGPKITSRMLESGGVCEIEKERGFRDSDTEKGVDLKTGHGDAWRRARAIVQAVGCDRVRRWVEDDDEDNEAGGEYRYTFDVGRALEAEARRGLKRVWKVAKRGKLDRESVLARALAIADTLDADEQIGRLQRQQIAMKMARIADTKRRSDVCYGALAEFKSRTRAQVERRPSKLLASALGRVDIPEGPPGIIRLKAIGFTVSRGASGFAVYHQLPPPRDGSGAKPPRLLKCDDLPTSAAAWDAARRLL